MCRLFNRMTLPRLQSMTRVLASVVLRQGCPSKAAGKIKKILSSFDRIAMMRLHLSGHRFVVSMFNWNPRKIDTATAWQPQDDDIQR